MKFHKLISVILHPIVIPTIGVILFFLLSSEYISKERQYLLIGIVFFSTYIIPLILLIILKAIGLINSFQVESIKERKIPIFLMLIIFYVLAKFLYEIPSFKGLGIMFYGTNFSLIIIYLLSFFKIKTSLHIASMSNALGFILVFSQINNVPALTLIIPTIILTGILGVSRLSLKAHKPNEIYIAFFLGIITQYLSFLTL